MLSLVLAGALGAGSDGDRKDTSWRHEEATMGGYVTAIQADGRVDVSGEHLRLAPNASITRGPDSHAPLEPGLGRTYLGQGMTVWGKYDRKTNTLTATHVTLLNPPTGKIHGGAMIDAPPAADAAGERVARADGRMLHLPAAATLDVNDGATLAENQWIDYEGTDNGDGTVTVAWAALWPNKVSADEARYSQSRDYDPAAMNPGKEQNSLGRTLLGVDMKQVPASEDQVAQARVARIGEALVPAYQKALPENDPTKIHFRFWLVNAPKGHRFPAAQASGVVALPVEAYDRLTSDSEIAALLADGVADVLEKQAIRHRGDEAWVRAGQAASVGAAVVDPSLAMGGWFGMNKLGNHWQAARADQSGRVALWLMHDAGYEVAAAPVAWWRLEGKTADKPLSEVALPQRTLNLYAELGTTWRPRAAE